MKAFLEIGNLRNQLVHENYADFRLDKTVDEIYGLYRTALYFLRVFPDAIRTMDRGGERERRGRGGLHGLNLARAIRWSRTHVEGRRLYR